MLRFFIDTATNTYDESNGIETRHVIDGNWAGVTNEILTQRTEMQSGLLCQFNKVVYYDGVKGQTMIDANVDGVGRIGFLGVETSNNIEAR